MLQLELEERLKSVERFNRWQEKVNRDRPYVPMVIDETTDTSSQDWMMECLALHIVNKESRLERENAIEKLKGKNQKLYEMVLPRVLEIEKKFFGINT